MAYSTASLPNDTPQVAKMHSLTYYQIMDERWFFSFLFFFLWDFFQTTLLETGWSNHCSSFRDPL